MLRPKDHIKDHITAILSAWSLLVLLTLTCCAGCGNKDSSKTPAGTGAPAAAGTASLPMSAQSAAQAQEKSDAANHAAHAPH